MIAKISLLALVALLCLGSASASDGQAFQLIRQLQDMQDGLSVGVDMPEGESDRLLARFVDLARDRATTWPDRRNRSALLFYLLTGGDPEPLLPILSGLAQNSPDRSLIEAAFAHARAPLNGKPGGIGLAAIDPREASPETAAVIALAQARLLVDSDRPAALQKLRASRSLAPGGFIEDAALRQELLFLDRNSDPIEIQRVALRYLSRFSKSVFVGSFIRRLETLCEQILLSDDLRKQAGVAALLEELPQEHRASIALSLARSALIKGQMSGAILLVKAGCANASGVVEIAERCSLYSQLAGIAKSAEPLAGASAAALHIDAVDRLLRQCGVELFGGDENQPDRTSVGNRSPEADAEQSGSDLMQRVRERSERAERYLSGGS